MAKNEQRLTANEQRLTVMEMAKKHQYLARGIKTFKGHDGQTGLNATLYREEKKVATVFDDARGGDFEWYWIDPIEEENLVALLKDIPPALTEYDFVMGVDIDNFIDYLVDDVMNENWFKRKCKTQTLFTLHDSPEGTHKAIRHPYSERIKAFLQETYPNQIKEIINERY